MSLHEELVEAAEEDGVSLNQFVCSLLASSIRWRQKDDEGARGLQPGSDRVSKEEYARIWRNTRG